MSFSGICLMRVAIFGLGYVGLTTAGCLVRMGHSVVGYDPNEAKIEEIRRGRSPIFEPGLDELLQLGLREGRVVAAMRPDAQLDGCDLAIVCVGTPSLPSGAHNLSYIAEVSRQLAQLCAARQKPLTVAFRSTMRPGTMDEIVAPLFANARRSAGKAVELVYNPEFLRESSAIKDFFDPPKIVVGTADGHPSATMAAVYGGIKAPTFVTRFREAELTKFVDNSFHALKVAFANEIGRVCSQLGISASTVHEIFVADTKLNISPRYLRPGGPFGGSCLPKDVRALSHLARDVGVNTSVVDALITSNEAHKRFLAECSTKDLPRGSKVLLCGLAFKPNSDDLRESPNVDLARKLLQDGHKLSIYDPVIEPSKLIGANFGYTYSQLPAINSMLVSKEAAESEDFDLVIDANGTARSLQIRSPRFFDACALA